MNRVRVVGAANDVVSAPFAGLDDRLQRCIARIRAHE
jgi:hypothetical protein